MYSAGKTNSRSEGGGHHKIVLPSEEYLSNLRQSFDFSLVPQSQSGPGNARSSRNLRKEDNTVLYAKMQNQRLWQISSKYKSLQKMTVSALNE